MRRSSTVIRASGGLTSGTHCRRLISRPPGAAPVALRSGSPSASRPPQTGALTPGSAPIRVLEPLPAGETAAGNRSFPAGGWLVNRNCRLIWSANVKRRQMAKGQIAMMGALGWHQSLCNPLHIAAGRPKQARSPGKRARPGLYRNHCLRAKPQPATDHFPAADSWSIAIVDAARSPIRPSPWRTIKMVRKVNKSLPNAIRPPHTRGDPADQ
jgi:hypothetical protein